MLLSSFALALTPNVTHAATHFIVQKNMSSDSECSATAIGPHALLTANHCEVSTDELYIYGLPQPVHILGRIRDDNDHSIYLVDGPVFPYAHINLKPDYLYGMRVYMFGNPDGHIDFYRQGYAVGIGNTGDAKDIQPDEIMFDLNIFRGDSGAALFDLDGNIIGVISQAYVTASPQAAAFTLKFAIVYRFQFKQDDIDRAIAFVPKD